MRLQSTIVLCLVLVGSGALSGCAGSPKRTAAEPERDILELVQEHPLNSHTFVYGDPHLESAVKRLSDIPRPWTVPKIIQLFEHDSREWLRKLQQRRDEKNPNLWPESDAERTRCGDLARLLAGSGDPRAAVALGRTLNVPDFPAIGDVACAVFEYFVKDDNYGLPLEKWPKSLPSNFLIVEIPAAQRWWTINQRQLEIQAAQRQRASDSLTAIRPDLSGVKFTNWVYQSKPRWTDSGELFFWFFAPDKKRIHYEPCAGAYAIDLLQETKRELVFRVTDSWGTAYDLASGRRISKTDMVGKTFRARIDHDQILDVSPAP